MNGLMAWMEKYILPTAAKIGAQKHLVALRDAFIGTLPATMAGSVAVMINAIIRDLPQEFVSTYAASLEADKGIFAVLNVIIGINGFVWNGTLAIAGLIFAFSWGYNLAKAYNVNELAGGIVSLATLISGVAFAPNNTAELAVKVPEKIANAINGAEIGASIANNQLTVNPWGWLNLNGGLYFEVQRVSDSSLHFKVFFIWRYPMELFQWVIETVAVQRNGENKMHVFHITTFDKSKKNAMDIARLKTKRLLKRKNIPYLRVTICWIQFMEVVRRTKYEEYKQLVRLNKSKKVIARLLNLPFWEVNKLERRYQKERCRKYIHQANSN